MIKKENRKRYEGCYGIETLEPGQNIRQQSVGRSFTIECFCMKHETFYCWDMIHSVATHICSFARVWV